jgi:hypothetical protein
MAASGGRGARRDGHLARRDGAAAPGAVVAMGLLLAFAVAACRGAGANPAPTPTSAPSQAALATTEPAAAPSTAPSPEPTLDLPDPSGLDALLSDIDNALSAESSAAAGEGSDR